MKLKYKKAILLTMMSVIGIGYLIISLSNSNSNTLANNRTDAAKPEISEKANEERYIDPQDSSGNEVTPLPLPVYHIEEDGYPKITELITSYYSAMYNCDVNALQNLASDPSAVYTSEELMNMTEYNDGYQNIKAYVKKNYIDGTYIVYAYYENQIINIKTPAPSLSKFYVITDASGGLKIFFGTIPDKETKAYYDARNTDEDVIELKAMTNKKYDEAKASDKDLKNYCDKLEALSLILTKPYFYEQNYYVY